ncbi:hypothetical protein FRC14_005227 [Serendipita sp. 396]|nr:hypothetical protein FRC14_005227 [Serendipita sp. 396]
MEWIKNRLLSKSETVYKEGVVGHKGGGGGGGGGGEEQRLATVNGTYPIVVRTRLMSKELLALLDANPRLARNVHTLRLYEAAKDSSDMDYGRFCAEAPRQLPNLRHLVIEGWLYSLLSTTAQKSLGDWCSKVTSITLSNLFRSLGEIDILLFIVHDVATTDCTMEHASCSQPSNRPRSSAWNANRDVGLGLHESSADDAVADDGPQVGHSRAKAAILRHPRRQLSVPADGVLGRHPGNRESRP